MTRDDTETMTTTAAAAARSGEDREGRAADPYARGANGLLLDPEAARREARRGWVMLTGVFAGGALLVVLAALVT
ncbi:MAG TPA: hypothetical protein VNT55_13265 [Baekduia sp.]|nr:hypothetical protein [Baekduia sp.]